jgi:tripartite-type tricarboxylate transporter receptor subunit TctC
MRTIILGALAGVAAFSLATAANVEPYPSSPLTIVVPFSPGGSNDFIGRFLAEELGNYWGQSVVVKNMPGAGTTIGTANFVRSPADGHTLLFVSGSVAMNAATQPELPFDPLVDLQPVAMVARADFAIVVGNRVHTPTLNRLVQAAESQTIFYGTFGAGSSGHVGGALIATVLGVRMEPVHYRGGSQALLDLAGGRIDVVVGLVPGLRASIAAGGVTPIAIMSEVRSEAMPNVPTVVEAGYPEAVLHGWWGVFAPAGTPTDIVDDINHAVSEVVNSAAGAKFLGSHIAVPADLTPEEFTNHYLAEIERFRRLGFTASNPSS